VNSPLFRVQLRLLLRVSSRQVHINGLILWCSLILGLFGRVESQRMLRGMEYCARESQPNGR